MAETIPGGYFEDAPGSGTFHDANGKPVPKRSDADLKKARESVADQSPAQREAAAAQHAAELQAEDARAAAKVAEDRAKAAAVEAAPPKAKRETKVAKAKK